MSNPIVSIIVPCYNQAQFLDECLQSVFDQRHLNWECIIVDDGSPDDTKIVAQKWVDKDERYQYLWKENGGLCNARNFGIKAAKGTYILPLDADDKIAINYVSLALEALLKQPDLKVVYCKAEKFGEASGIWELLPFNLHNLSQSNMIFCTALFRKKDWEKVGGYDEKMVFGWEDWEFWIALLKDGGTVHQLDYVGFYYRIKEGSMLLDIDSKKSETLMQYLNVKHADFFVKQYGSFKAMEHKEVYAKREFESKLKSKKFVIDLFLKTFFGCTFFGNNKK